MVFSQKEVLPSQLHVRSDALIGFCLLFIPGFRQAEIALCMQEHQKSLRPQEPVTRAPAWSVIITFSQAMVVRARELEVALK